MNIIKATLKEKTNTAKLFAEYRLFYGQEYDIAAAETFISKRLVNDDSVIFLATDGTDYLGFVQLYPSFTSIGVQEIWILNDLFVSEQHRRKGVAEVLIKHVLQFSNTSKRKKVILSTAYSNSKAQQLYEKLGFKRTEFYNYEKNTNETAD
ncbi:MAG: GNAT family N-acetyltransferase [Agriterribacter sp.]